jgi:UDP-N-acetylglucosamine 2-epimerase (non-hydrolysing)
VITQTNVRPLTIFTGTKAQFIKLVPLMLEFERRGWTYRLIDTGQHAELASRIVREFGVRTPDYRLCTNPSGVSTLAAGARWSAHMTRHLMRRPSWLRDELFGGQAGISFVHGDTASTLLSTLIAKRGGQLVAHIEAGLRSHRLTDPFPEELVRVIVMRLADILYAPSHSAMNNLKRMRIDDKAVQLPGNTGMDTLARSLRRQAPAPTDLPSPFGLATFHRLETLYSKTRMHRVVDLLLRAHARTKIVLLLHRPTKLRLAATGLDSRLLDSGVTCMPLVDHPTFARLIRDAAFVLTDGGSVQEESSYLGTPCALLRATTERADGLNDNVMISDLEPSRLDAFLDRLPDYRRPSRLDDFQSPSAVIADHVAGLA